MPIEEPSTADFADRLIAIDEALRADGAADDATGMLSAELSVLRRLHDFGRRNRVEAKSPSALKPGGAFGRFQVRRLIGHGGFGSVFLAFDPLLEREVALKVPHAEALVTADRRERFRREAQATAGLDHPNIVPMYEAGAVGPICYLVSAYCSGGNLAQFLLKHSGPVPVKQTAEWVRQLADGVHHAHERGVLHRDLKPANMLLQPVENAPAIPKVCDFGLAKIVDSDAALTRSGLVIGTPQYMAPEQALSTRGTVTPATDVYGLGVVLYELLVGRPPFLAESALETLQQVCELDPASPRQLRPTVPRDLETICLKCLHKEPSRRYATAAELSADLRRFLGGETIRARPMSIWGKSWRWARRRPATAGLTAALLINIVFCVAAIIVQLQHAKQLAAANAVERDRAQTNYHRARALVDRLNQAGLEFSRKPGFDKVQHAVYAELLKYYQQVVAEGTEDPVLLREAALAGAQLIRVHRALANHKEASAVVQSTKQLYERLLAMAPSDRKLREEQYDCYWQHGLALRIKDRDGALREFATAITLMRSLCADYPESEQYLSNYANALLNWAANKPFYSAEADEAISEALAIYQRQIDERPDDSRRFDYALALDDLGYLRAAQKRYDEAEELHQKGLAIRQQLVNKWPEFSSYQLMLARSYERLGSLRVSRGNLVEAERYYGNSVAPMQSVIKLHPDQSTNYRLLAHNLNRWCDLLEQLGRHAETITHYRSAVKAWQKVVELHPKDEDHIQALARQQQMLGTALGWQGAHAEAISLLKKALKSTPNDSLTCATLAVQLALVKDDKLRAPGEAAALAARAWKAGPHLAATWSAVGVTKLAVGDAKAAAANFATATLMSAGRVPDDWLLLAKARAQLGQVDAARTALAKAPTKLSDSPRTKRLRSEVMLSLNGSK